MYWVLNVFLDAISFPLQRYGQPLEQILRFQWFQCNFCDFLAQFRDKFRRFGVPRTGGLYCDRDEVMRCGKAVVFSDVGGCCPVRCGSSVLSCFADVRCIILFLRLPAQSL